MDPTAIVNGKNGALIHAAFVSLHAGNYKDALLQFRKLRELEPENPVVFNGLGVVLGKLGFWDKAVAAFGVAFKFKPDLQEICSNYLFALLQTGRLEEAVAVIANKHSVIPYALGAAVISRFAASEAGRKYMIRNNWAESYTRLLALLGINADNDRITSFIYANLLFPHAPWREKSLDNSSTEEIEKWISWKGLEQFVEITRQGAGVILVHSHFTLERLASLLLARKGYSIYSLEFKNRLGNFGIKGADSFKSIELDPASQFYLRQVYAARKALGNGAILQIAGDGDYGQSTATVQFLGQEQKFRTGFAEMVLISKAPAVALFCTVSLDGKILIELSPALDPGDETADRQTRITGLVQQYAGLLEQKWRSNPDNLSYQHLGKFVGRGFSFIDNSV